ncbi:MAG TPA: hypothetical protein VKX96_10990 [Chloroflexota bacterium]|jgi:hydroxymethylpyrimidine/phosphomethylpyrimidine kinase|nr:hypothetical protein [Chloroflexota bacterium]
MNVDFPVVLDLSRIERVGHELYPLTDYVTPNHYEAEQPTGIPATSV